MNKKSRKQLEIEYDYLKFVYISQNDYRTYRMMWILSNFLLIYAATNIIYSTDYYIFWILTLFVAGVFFLFVIFEGRFYTSHIIKIKKELEEIYKKLKK